MVPESSSNVYIAVEDLIDEQNPNDTVVVRWKDSCCAVLVFLFAVIPVLCLFAFLYGWFEFL